MTATRHALTASVLDSVGSTPLMEMNLQHEGETWHFFAKLEFMNPTGSVKDRIAKFIVEEAEKRGELKPDSVIIEATSGNTGIGLSMVAAVKGYKLTIVMPEHMSIERQKIMAFLGAELCLTPTPESFAGSRDRAEHMAQKNPRVFLPRQFQNPDNTRCHYETTGREIVEQLGGRRVDAFIAGVGTGGTLMGVGRRFRETNPDCKLVAVEPAESAVLSGCQTQGVHQIAGIGDGFIPELLDVKYFDWPDVISSCDAVKMAQTIGRRYGMMVGVSSGANVLSAINVLKRIGRDKLVVTVLPDRSERYFSTDLYGTCTDLVVRSCRKGCENPFCEFRFKT